MQPAAGVKLIQVRLEFSFFLFRSFSSSSSSFRKSGFWDRFHAAGRIVQFEVFFCAGEMKVFFVLKELLAVPDKMLNKQENPIFTQFAWCLFLSQ